MRTNMSYDDTIMTHDKDEWKEYRWHLGGLLDGRAYAPENPKN